ncbi:hypothetical protein HDU76_011216 [Blyttiomyces sp. JEL0837]|nr:hypothetical protein HDU76_011216 [Blyttiomyces sp. JEL0837]
MLLEFKKLLKSITTASSGPKFLVRKSAERAGCLKHQDSMGNLELLPRGHIQFTSAGTGMKHSEMNNSNQNQVHFLQFWSPPSIPRLPPSYSTKNFTDIERTDQKDLTPMIIPVQRFPVPEYAKVDGELNTDKSFRGMSFDRLIGIHQDLYMFSALLTPGARTRHVPVANNRKLYVHVVECDNVDVKLGVSCVSNGKKELKDDDGHGNDIDEKKYDLGDDGSILLEGGDGLFVGNVSEGDEFVFENKGDGLVEFVVLDMTTAEKSLF